MTFPYYLLPLHAPLARGGEEERAINDRAHALSYDMSSFQGYTSELLRLLNCVHSILVVTYIQKTINNYMN